MNSSQNIKNVLIYARQSRDDAGINYERIEEQARLLKKYCLDNKLGNIVDIIIDDNKSGTDFSRLDGVKERIRRGEIDIFLCKDSSRLGRLQRESLEFADFLHEHGAQLVMESEKYEEDFFGLRAWLNERRAREDGIKSKNALKKRMEAGSMVIKAPYGYIKTGKNELTIDPDAAPIVQEIFDLFIKGYAKAQIIGLLNKREIPTPSQLKEQYKNQNYCHLWNKQHIERILRHIIYTGDMPYAMREKVSYKVKKFINKPKEEWIIIANHHKPIISKEVFELAQQRFRINAKYRVRNSDVNIFSGLLLCGRCGRRMYRKARVNRRPWYNCSTNNIYGAVKDDIRAAYGCTSHKINEKDLTDLVSMYIERLAGEAFFREKVMSAIGSAENKKKRLEAQIAFLSTGLKSLSAKLSRMYDDKLEGLISQKLYLLKQQEINNKIADDTAEIEKLKNSLRQISEENDLEAEYFRITEQIKNAGVKNDTLLILFKQIIVFEPGEVNEVHLNNYELGENEFQSLSENGGVLFVQNFRYKVG